MKIVKKIKKLIKRICNDIYFLKYGGVGDAFVFVFGSIFFLGLAICAIGIFILPITFIIALLSKWLGLEVLANKIVVLGYIVICMGAYLSVILYYAEMNVNSYREKLVADTKNERNN